MRSDIDTPSLIQPEEIADIVEFLLKYRGNAMIDNIDVRRSNGTPFALHHPDHRFLTVENLSFK